MKPTPLTIIHVLLDHEDRLRETEKALSIKLAPDKVRLRKYLRPGVTLGVEVRPRGSWRKGRDDHRYECPRLKDWPKGQCTCPTWADRKRRA